MGAVLARAFGQFPQAIAAVVQTFFLPDPYITHVRPHAKNMIAKLRPAEESIVTCYDSRLVKAAACASGGGGSESAYERMVDAVLRMDIFNGETEVFMPPGNERIHKDMLMAISTTILDDPAYLYCVSLEDIADLQQDDTTEWRRTRVVICTRRSNVVEGTYTIEVRLWRRKGCNDATGEERQKGDIEVMYGKRQSLVHWLSRNKAPPDVHRAMTERSIALTLDKISNLARVS